MTHVTAPSIDWFCIFNDSRWFIILLLCLTAFRNLTLVAKLPTFMFLLCFFIFVSCFLYMLSYFPAFFLVPLFEPQNTSLVLISLDWFCIFNYTLFSSDCFTMQPRWNDDDVYRGHDTWHDSLTWPILHILCSRFYCFRVSYQHDISTVFYFLWLCLLFLFLCRWLFSLHILSKQANTPLVLLSLDWFWIFN